MAYIKESELKSEQRHEILKNNGLSHDPFKAIVAPRPIGWISTRSKAGVHNIAPYSFFNAVASNPKVVMFSSQGLKDSLINLREWGEFTCNYVSHDLLNEMNESSAAVDASVDEFQLTGLEAEQGEMVDVLRVKSAYAALECKLLDIYPVKDIEGNSSDFYMILGQVVGTYLSSQVIKNGRFDVNSARPVSRLGYLDYATLEPLFELDRPKN
jgi:flavin reductase (DIM6/NTAB) family NADH-FMN oxidoreductase RutF